MLLTYIKVFIVGGIICLIAQIMMDYFKMQTPYVMVTYVSLGAVLTLSLIHILHNIEINYIIEKLIFMITERK